ncbi:MAG: hypothetical protein AAF304_02985 [Pseudomonadota bacterium]
MLKGVNLITLQALYRVSIAKKGWSVMNIKKPFILAPIGMLLASIALPTHAESIFGKLGYYDGHRGILIAYDDYDRGYRNRHYGRHYDKHKHHKYKHKKHHYKKHHYDKHYYRKYDHHGYRNHHRDRYYSYRKRGSYCRR